MRVDGTLWCWGDNTQGQLGDGTHTFRSTPIRVGAANDWGSVMAGAEFSCGLRTGGILWCWGANGKGQLGNDWAWEESPVAVP